MIAKVSTGRSFGGTVRYLHEGHKNELGDKGAQLLDYNGIRPGMNEMIKDFDRHRWLNPDLGNAVGHISLSYHQQDSHRINDAKMVEHAQAVMKRLGMNPDETQYALIRHTDRDHHHCHLVYNRVDYHGKTISDQFSKGRAREAVTIIARQEGLTVASEKKKDLTLTHKANLTGYDQARYQVYEAIQQELPQATSIKDLAEALKTHRIETISQKTGKGLSFRIGEHSVKASAVDRAYSGDKLHETVEQNRELKLKLEQRNALNADAFGALGDFMKKREEAQAFSQLADLVKNRETLKGQARKQEQAIQKEQELKQEPKLNRSPGLGL